MSIPSSPDSGFSEPDFFSTPSTTPSSPVPPEFTHFLIPSQVDAQFLRSLPLQAWSEDTVLLLRYTGNAADVLPLLNRVQVLHGIPVFDNGLWQLQKSQDGVEYFKISSRGSEASVGKTRLIFDNMVNMSPGKLHSPADFLNLFSDSCLRLVSTIESPTHALYVLERPPFTFPRLSLTPVHHLRNPIGTPYGAPALSEFRDLWQAWDLVTLGMIPQEMLHQKPIDLRHKFLFYLGHIPTFVNILMSQLFKEPYTEPKKFTTIFERGIDPHVDDPDHCHNHSEVPERDEDWPALSEIIDYRDRVRERLSNIYSELESGKRTWTRRIARTLMMILEHEGFHVETLLYMVIQGADSDGRGTLPPPGFRTPLWEVLADEWKSAPQVLETVTLGPGILVMGHNDCESDDILPHFEHQHAGHEFGWDNESPRREVMVEKFKIDTRPITNGDFYDFWKQNNTVSMPVSWLEESGKIKVRTVYGPVPIEVATSWPVLTSYDNLSIIAKSKGGRIPTEHELRMFLDEYNVTYEEGANVGFRNWHPLPATAGGSKYKGRGSNGGIWEWTSTALDAQEGFVGTSIFPGYSSDFFDTKHHVVLGGSYATIPRIADRRTVRNFYQHNYPYPWVGARVAYDI